MSEWLSEIRRRLSSAGLDPGREAEIAHELEQHLEDRYSEMRALGHDEQEARRAALAELDDDVRMRRELSVVTPAEREPAAIGAPSGGSWLRDFVMDVRYAFRSLRRNPGFTAVAAATLALGIGANTALFSVADAVLLKPLPYPEPDRIVEIEGAPFQITDTGMRVARQMAESPAFTSVGLYAIGGLNAGGEPHAERLRAAAVTAGFFEALGAQPALGRVFTHQEADEGQRVVVIGHSVWTNRFARDPGVVGRELVLNGNPFVVIGVMPPRYVFPDRSDVWIPGRADRQIAGAAFAPTTVARMAPGVSLLQARDEVERVNAVRRGGRPADPRELPAEVTSLREELVGAVRPLLFVISAAVLLVLLVACINTANLLLARVSAREREMAVRRALGASSGRLMRYLLSESAVLAGLAGLVAIPAAYWTLAALRHLVPASIHGAQDIALDGRAAAVTAALCITSAVIFGLAPVLSVRRRPATEVLRGVSTTAGPFWRRFRGVLVAAELAAAVVLLAGAATVVKTVWSLLAVDLGARGERALTMQLTLPRAKYADAAQMSAFFDRLALELRSVPVEAAGAASTMPGATEIGIGLSVRVEGVTPPAKRTSATYIKATPEYFKALGIDHVAGRGFTEQDRAEAPAVAIVGEGVPRALGVSAEELIGRRIDVSLSEKPRLASIVGVVRDVRLRGPERPAGTAIYLPFAQSSLFGTMYVAAKAHGDPSDLVPSVRAALARIDPNLPAYNVRTFDDIRASYVADRRFAMALMLAFAALTCVLAAIGLYGVMSYLVQLRVREIGIRVTLGASPGGVLRETMKGGLVYALGGVIVGTAAAGMLSKIFISRVPGLQQIEFVTLAVTALLMLLLAAATIWVPAKRASRVDPMEALRAEG